RRVRRIRIPPSCGLGSKPGLRGGCEECEASCGRQGSMSTHSEVAPGDAVHAGDPVVVDRYTTGARINHWITAASLVLLALSGLALFHPSLFFLSGLFGGGITTRMIHPWIGVVLFFSFIGLFFRFWRLDLWVRNDSVWMSRLRDV